MRSIFFVSIFSRCDRYFGLPKFFPDQNQMKKLSGFCSVIIDSEKNHQQQMNVLPKMDQIDQNSNDHHDGDDHVEAKHVYVLLTDRLVTVIIIVFFVLFNRFSPPSRPNIVTVFLETFVSNGFLII